MTCVHAPWCMHAWCRCLFTWRRAVPDKTTLGSTIAPITAAAMTSRSLRPETVTVITSPELVKNFTYKDTHKDTYKDPSNVTRVTPSQKAVTNSAPNAATKAVTKAVMAWRAVILVRASERERDTYLFLLRKSRGAAGSSLPVAGVCGGEETGDVTIESRHVPDSPHPQASFWLSHPCSITT